jgi:hypothetical protein
MLNILVYKKNESLKIVLLISVINLIIVSSIISFIHRYKKHNFSLHKIYKSEITIKIFWKKDDQLTADTDLLKMVSAKILLNFGNYIRILQLGFWISLSGIVLLYY